MLNHFSAGQPLTRLGFLALLVSPAALIADGHASGGVLTAQERSEIIAQLEESRSDTLGKIAALSDEQWKFKPGPERWSAAEIVEHLYLSEQGFHSRVDGLMAGKPNENWRERSQGKDQMITQVIPDRTNRVQAPPEVQPKGKESRGQVVEKYVSARSEMIERAKDGSLAYHAYMEESGTPLGPLSAAHWIRFAALHNVRHNKQLAEVLADPKFPQ